MANFENLIPFILHCEAGMSKRHISLPYPEMFEKARRTGFANDPVDPGGATMCGVTLATYTAYRTANRFADTTITDLRNISFDEWSFILRLMFWNRCKGDLISTQSVANALVDWTWGSGTYGITNVQRLLHVKPDGIVGPRTLASINGYPDQHELFCRIQRARIRYHQRIVILSPAKSKFLKGWNRRVNKITWEGFDYDS